MVLFICKFGVDGLKNVSNKNNNENISLGFWICSQVIQAGVGLIMPEFLFSGILWPSIGMIPVFKILGDILPLTLSCELARNLVNQESFWPVAGKVNNHNIPSLGMVEGLKSVCVVAVTQSKVDILT